MPLDPQKIRERREKLNLSQTDAAKLAGMLRPNWARIEAGKRDDPSVSTAESVAKALRVKVDALLA